MKGPFMPVTLKLNLSPQEARERLRIASNHLYRPELGRRQHRLVGSTQGETFLLTFCTGRECGFLGSPLCFKGRIESDGEQTIVRYWSFPGPIYATVIGAVGWWLAQALFTSPINAPFQNTLYVLGSLYLAFVLLLGIGVPISIERHFRRKLMQLFGDPDQAK